MSMPTISDINPDINISREDAINLLYASIGMEEMALAEIIKAESMKVKQVIKHSCDPCVIKEVNSSVESLLKVVITYESILQTKLKDIIDYDTKCHCNKDSKPKHRCRENKYTESCGVNPCESFTHTEEDNCFKTCYPSDDLRFSYSDDQMSQCYLNPCVTRKVEKTTININKTGQYRDY